MGWFGFGSQGQSPRRRSYHARGGFSRALAGSGGDEPQSVEDVVRGQTFWQQYRGQAAALYLLGLLGMVLLLTMGVTSEPFSPGVGFWGVGAFTLTMFAMPLLLFVRYKRQKRRFEQLAEEASPPERPQG